MDDMDDTNIDDRLVHAVVLRLAMLNALNDEKNYLVPVESRNLDLHHARIAYNVILRFRSNDPKFDPVMDEFFDAAFDICDNWISPHQFTYSHCRILAIACDMFYRLDGSINDRWGPNTLPDRCTKIWEELVPKKEHGDAQLFQIGWGKINSLLSHLVGRGYHKGLSRGFLEVRRALEKPMSKEPSLRICRVRVAAEWIINCGHLMRRKMIDRAGLTLDTDDEDTDDEDTDDEDTDDEDTDDEDTDSEDGDGDDDDSGYDDGDDDDDSEGEDNDGDDDDEDDSDDEDMRPGPTYGRALAFLSLHRWEFWKTRLAEFKVSRELDFETKQRVSTALELMREPSEWEERNSSLECAIKEQLEIVATKGRSSVAEGLPAALRD